MRYEILEQFFGQEVDVSLVSRSTVSGILGPSEMDGGYCDLVEVEPSSESSKKRYGSWVLDRDMITGIRLLKPHVDKDDDDDGDCCEKSS